MTGTLDGRVDIRSTRGELRRPSISYYQGSSRNILPPAEIRRKTWPSASCDGLFGLARPLRLWRRRSTWTVHYQHPHRGRRSSSGKVQCRACSAPHPPVHRRWRLASGAFRGEYTLRRSSHDTECFTYVMLHIHLFCVRIQAICQQNHDSNCVPIMVLCAFCRSTTLLMMALASRELRARHG